MTDTTKLVEPAPDAAALVAGVGAAERSRNVDIVRAAAALAVLLGHAYQLSGVFLATNDRNPFHIALNNGAAGVWFFFSLSGYLIAGPFIRALLNGTALPSIRNYGIRRVARIYPAYVLALAIVFAVGLPIGVHAHWWQYPVHFALLHNLVPGDQHAILFASWTLTLEILFYIFVPTAAYLIRRWRPGPIDAKQFARAICALWVASIGWGLAATQISNLEYSVYFRFLFPALLCMFCPGMLVSLGVAVWRRDGRPPAPFHWLMTHRVASVIAIAVLVVFGAVGSTINRVALLQLSWQAYALAAGLVVLLAITIAEPTGRLGGVLSWFGSISYGIYLWQAVVLAVIEHHGVSAWAPAVHTGAGAYVIHVVYLFVLVIPLSWLSWVVIERPMIAAAKRWTARPGSSTYLPEAQTQP